MSDVGTVASKRRTRAVRDFAPHIAPAGTTSRGTDPHGGARACLAQPVERHLPGAQALHSRVSRAEPGIRIVPVAQVMDPRPPASHSYGVSTRAEDDPDLLSQGRAFGALEGRVNERREARYKSAVAEPLGKSRVRGHRLPGEFERGERAFGVATRFGEDAKTVVFPTDDPDAGLGDDEPGRRRRTGFGPSTCAPGEQRRAGYDWTRVGDASDPVSPNGFRFGATEEREENGVARAIDVDANTEQFSKTKIVSLRLGKHREENAPCLGRTKPLGKRNPELAPDHVFGVSTAGRDEWGAGAVLRGAYAPEDQLPDPDLGRAKRTLDAPGRNDRVYGVPSIRHDISEPRVKSVANHNNYGGEPNAHGVVNPPKYASVGLFEEDFSELMNKDEMRGLMLVPEMEMDEDDFEAYWAHARRENNAGEELTIAQFRRSMLALQ